ncbi:MAG: adenine phosphoribosyltransferase, partial [Candelina submexicana]
MNEIGDSTSAHPPRSAPDATTHSPQNPKLSSTATSRAAQFSSHEMKDFPPASLSDNATPPLAHETFKPRASQTHQASDSTELSTLTKKIRASLRQYPDFPSPGILFEDILPIFASPTTHAALLHALELSVTSNFPLERPDVIVGLEARGFLFGPSLALHLGAAFVPLRKGGKLPGECETMTAGGKEYGTGDVWQLQKGAGVGKGKKVLVVDDVIATGGTAAAAGKLVNRLGATLMGYLFLLELDFLKGRDKLDAP